MRSLTPEKKQELTEYLLSENWGPFLWIGQMLLEKKKDSVMRIDPRKSEVDVRMEVARYQGAEAFFSSLQAEARRLKAEAVNKTSSDVKR
jgi:hypothetical protein